MEPDPEDLAPRSVYLGAFLHQIPQKLPIGASYLATAYQQDQATDAALILDQGCFSNPAGVSPATLDKLIPYN